MDPLLHRAAIIIVTQTIRLVNNATCVVANARSLLYSKHLYSLKLHANLVWRRIPPETNMQRGCGACLLTLSLPHAVNCGRFCFWRCQSLFFACVRNISGIAKRICAKFTRKTCLVPRSDEFEGQGQRSKVKVTGNKKRHFRRVSEWVVS